MLVRLITVLFCLLVLAAPIRVTANDTPVVVELFTSQSCYSCPPAEAFLAALADVPGVLALEWHVDYWNDLVYGSAGRWEDPFSDPAFTERQRAYNARLLGSRRAYTPQMVVQGRTEAVGSKRLDVQRLIQSSAPSPVRLDWSADGLTVTGPVDLQGKVVLVTLHPDAQTRVTAGENKGKTLRNRRIVRGATAVGTWQGGTAILPLTPPETACAVLVQAAAPAGILGPVLGAVNCP